jgi:hypothetical protein
MEVPNISQPKTVHSGRALVGIIFTPFVFPKVYSSFIHGVNLGLKGSENSIHNDYFFIDQILKELGC